MVKRDEEGQAQEMQWQEVSSGFSTPLGPLGPLGAATGLRNSAFWFWSPAPVRPWLWDLPHVQVEMSCVARAR